MTAGSGLIEQIAKTMREDSRADATAESSAAKLSEHQRRKRIRERNRVLWIDYYATLAESFALRSAEFQRRARALEGREE